MGNLLYGNLTEQIIGAAHEVHSALGPGMIESVYEIALAHEVQLRGLPVRRQVRQAVSYKGVLAGEFFMDMVVDEKVLVELKATSEHNKVFEVQVVYYLKGSGLRVGLLLNFGMESLCRKRFVN